MHHLKNIFADVFSTSTFLSGLLFGIDWAKILGALGIIAAIANHLHQIYYRRKNNKKNKK